MRKSPEKINILFVIMTMAMGGSERLVFNIIKKIDKRVFRPHLAWFYGEEVLREFQQLNIPLFHVPKTRRFDLHTMVQLAEIIEKYEISVVNAHHFMSMVYSFYGSKIRKRAKLIYTEHSEWELDLVSRKWRWLGKYLLNNADKSVGVSQSVTACLQDKFTLSEDKVFTIENGVEFDLYFPQSPQKYLREKLGLQPDEKIIGIVANLKKVKNHIFLLRAFHQLVQEHSRSALVIIGQGFADDPDNTESDIRLFIDQAGLQDKVHLLGFRQDVSLLLPEMDIFCLTSTMEGMPISIIEAMACGLPVVGSDVMGIRDIIRDGDNGFVVPLHDVSALKKALLQLVQDDNLRERMGQKSLIYSKRYSLQSCLKKYVDIFLQ